MARGCGRICFVDRYYSCPDFDREISPNGSFGNYQERGTYWVYADDVGLLMLRADMGLRRAFREVKAERKVACWEAHRREL